MKQRDIALLAAIAGVAALPLPVLSAQSPATSESFHECQSGPTYSTRVEWGLPADDCKLAIAEPKTPGGVLGTVRSMDADMQARQSIGEWITPGSAGNLLPF